MVHTWAVYAFWDTDVMFYVGVTSTDLPRRIYMHHWFAKRDERDPLKRRVMALGDHLRVESVATFPERRQALLCERDLIAQVGIEEDGGTLMNTKRSSIGPAGYTKAVLKKISDAAKRANEKPEYRRQLRERARRMAADPERRAELSQKLKDHWSDPDAHERALAIQHSDEVQAKRAAEMKRRWDDPAFREKMKQRRTPWETGGRRIKDDSEVRPVTRQRRKRATRLAQLKEE